MRVSEAPNGKVSVSVTDTSQNSPQEGNSLQALIKMIEKHENYSNLDGWLAKNEFVTQYKSEILSKLIDLPAEVQEPEQNAFFRPIPRDRVNPDLFGGGMGGQPAFRPQQPAQPLFGAN